MGGKFQLLASDKEGVVAFVNSLGALTAEQENKSTLDKINSAVSGFVFGDAGHRAVKDELLKLGLDSHEARKTFLANKMGIDANTPDNYRLVAYQNEMGQEILFRGHMDGDKKLVLTDSLPMPETPGQVHQFFQSSFKALPKPIEVSIEKSTVNQDGSISFELSPQEQTKLQTQATFASLVHKADGVQLTSNAALPGKPQTTGPILSA